MNMQNQLAMPDYMQLSMAHPQFASKSLQQMQSSGMFGDQFSLYGTDPHQQLGRGLPTDSPTLKYINNFADNEQNMFKMMPSAAVTQPITKIFNPVQSSMLNPFGFDEYYGQNPYNGF